MTQVKASVISSFGVLAITDTSSVIGSALDESEKLPTLGPRGVHLDATAAELATQANIAMQIEPLCINPPSTDGPALSRAYHGVYLRNFVEWSELG